MSCNHDHTILQASRLWCKDCSAWLPLDVFVKTDEDLMALINVMGIAYSPVRQESVTLR